MPKDVIRSRPEIDDGSLPWMSVGWGKESGHVQLGVAGPESDYKLMGRDGPDGEWKEITGSGDGIGLFVQLDRAGINRTIRSLRKARDDAFGRDE